MLSEVKNNLRKWGNSLGIRVPKVFVEQLGLKENSEVEVKVVGEEIVISKSKAYSLEKLLKKVDKDVLHMEIDLGPIKGKEIW